jgi:hypothetical protein
MSAACINLDEDCCSVMSKEQRGGAGELTEAFLLLT